MNFRLDPLGIVEGFTAEVGASGVFCPTHMTLPVEVSFYSVSDDNAPSPYMGVITLESLGKRGYRVPPSGTIQVAEQPQLPELVLIGEVFHPLDHFCGPPLDAL